MRVEAQREQDKFRPITVSLTLETATEVGMLLKLTSMHTTVANLVQRNFACSDTGVDQLDEMLNAIYAKVSSANAI